MIGAAPTVVEGSAAAGRRAWPGWLRDLRLPSWRTLVLALPSLLLLERAWDRRWMTDDGFINLRVVRMIEAGHGPVFNVGERVEVTTSTLWVWMLTLGDVLLPIRLEWVAVVGGLACGVVGLAAATAGAALLHRANGDDRLLVPAGAVVLAVVAPLWDFTTSGLEGGLTFGWLGVTTYVVARWARGERRLSDTGAVVVGLGPLVRPDLALVSGVVLAAVLVGQWGDVGRRGCVRTVVAAVALPLAYQVFRMGYYAALVPNTALAKAGGRSRLGTGVAYLRDFVDPYVLVVPLVALLALVLGPAVGRAVGAGRRRVALGLVAVPLGGLLQGLYVVRVGGDYMHGRMLLPAFFALFATVAAVPAPLPARGRADRSSRSALVQGGAVAVALGWSLVCLAWLRPDGTADASDLTGSLFSSDAHAGNVATFGEHAVTTDDQHWGGGLIERVMPPGFAVYAEMRPLDVRPPAGLRTPAYAGFGVGISGYALGTDVTIVDMLGLADPINSRFELERPGHTGHEKPMPAPWLAARVSAGPVDPGELPEPAFAVPLYLSPPERFDADTEAARHVSRCGEVAELWDAVREPMSPGRFLSNLVSAPRFTLMSVPPDPEAAVARFC